MNLDGQKTITAAPFVLRIEPGDHADSWLVHPTKPIMQRRGRKVQPTFGFVDTKDGESVEDAFERKYGDWTESKDLTFLMEQGFTSLDSINVFSDEPSAQAPFLSSGELLIVDGATIRSILLADFITAEQYRQNQIVALTQHCPLVGRNVGVSSHLPAGSKGVALSIFLHLSRE